MHSGTTLVEEEELSAERHVFSGHVIGLWAVASNTLTRHPFMSLRIAF